jgi:hypothetical protein
MMRFQFLVFSFQWEADGSGSESGLAAWRKFPGTPAQTDLLYSFKDFKFAGEIALSSQFGGRAFGDAEEADEVQPTVTLVAFCDVRRNRNSGPDHLVTQRKVARGLKGFRHINCQAASTFPDFEFLKRLVGHGKFSVSVFKLPAASG